MHIKNKYKADNNAELTVDRLFSTIGAMLMRSKKVKTWNSNPHLVETMYNHYTVSGMVCEVQHHTNTRHRETTTITQNPPYAGTTPGATLASMDATAHITTCHLPRLMSQKQMTHHPVQTEQDVMARPLFTLSHYQIFNLQRPSTEMSLLVNSTFTVKATTFSSTAMLDSGFSTCIVPISQLLKEARKWDPF